MFGTYGSATLDANMGTQFRPFRGDDFSLAVVFGIVFPSCTGVMSGVNMSGDLANAQHSIPRGTAAGYAFTIAHIFVLIFLLAGSVQRDALVTRTDTIMSESCYSSLLGSSELSFGKKIFKNLDCNVFSSEYPPLIYSPLQGYTFPLCRRHLAVHRKHLKLH